jgi:hypothetical protein
VHMYHLYQGVLAMQMKKPSSIKGLILSTIALFSLLLSGNAAHAAMVAYSFDGTVGSVSGALRSTLPAGSSMVGTFSYDTVPSGTTGRYMDAVQSLSFTIGGYSVALVPMGETNVIRITDSPSGDLWRLRTSVTGDPVGMGEFKPVDFRLDLADEDGLAITGKALNNPPSLGDLTSTHWRLVFEDMDGKTVRVQGVLNSLTAVPLPAAVILFGAGLISLVGLGAGGLRNLRRPHQA